jgi:DNA-binding NarL/FixJ family response regulator
VTRPPPADEPCSRPLLVVDDHELVRAALVATLRGEGIDAYACTQATIGGILAEARTLPPGVVLLDLDLGTGPDGAHIDGIDAVKGLRAAGWTVLGLTGNPGVRSARIAAAIAAGAVGQVPKISSFDALVGTVRQVISGALVMTPEERRGWLDRDRAERLATRRRDELLGRLTARERVVLEQLAKGRRASEIATDSVVSVTTVRSQIRAILAKLELSSQLTAVALLRAEWEEGYRA